MNARGETLDNTPAPAQTPIVLRAFRDYRADFRWFAHCLACFRDRALTDHDIEQRFGLDADVDAVRRALRREARSALPGTTGEGCTDRTKAPTARRRRTGSAKCGETQTTILESSLPPMVSDINSTSSLAKAGSGSGCGPAEDGSASLPSRTIRAFSSALQRRRVRRGATIAELSSLPRSPLATQPRPAPRIG